jgi:two-component system capsular synthesis response regulator RcsB
MSDVALNKHIAILAKKPLMGLGIQQFIQDLQLGFQCVLVASSFLSLQKELIASDILLTVVELNGTAEEVRTLGNQILSLSDNYPDMNIIVYAECCDITLLSLLYYKQKISLIAQGDSLKQIRQDLEQWLMGCKVCSASIALHFERARAQINSGLQVLTRTERRILQNLLAGLSLTEIASLSHRSVKTVSAHKCNSMRKLGVCNDLELFRFSQKSGLLPSRVIKNKR